MLFNRKLKNITPVEEEPEMKEQNPMDIDYTKLYTDTFESIAEKLLEHETVMTSPIDGTPIAVIRTEDVLNTITQYYGIDITKTKYSEYEK